MPTKQYRELKDFLLQHYPICECCGIGPGVELHHCIEKRRKGRKELDVIMNLEVACHQCHMSGKLDSSEHAIEFARKRIEEGYDVLGWYDGLTLITRRFPNLRGLL